MAKYQITSPDGQKYEIEAPDNASEKDVLSYAQKQFLKDPKALDYDKLKYSPTMGMGSFERVMAGAGKEVHGAGQAIGQMTGLTPQSSVDEHKALDKPLMSTPSGQAGSVIGKTGLLAPAMITPGVNTLTGAALAGATLGALEPTGTGESRVGNMALGTAGGLFGQGAANTVGRLIRPVQSQLPAELSGLAGKAKSYGIDLTPAQQTGSKPLKIVDSVLENLPFTADTAAKNKQLQRSQFNKAVLNTVGESSDTASPGVLNSARTRIGDEFKRLTENNKIKLGNDFLDTLAKVDADTTPFSSPQIRSAVDKALELAAKGDIDGKEYQKVRSVLGKASSDAFKGSNSELGQALKQIKSALDDAAGKSIPDADKQAWNLARKQWQNLKVIEKAAAPSSADAVSGNVSPGKLAQALLSTDRKGFTYGTGNQEMSDLARMGQAFIKDQIPDSGTAQRTFWQGVMENPLRLIPGAAGMGSVPMQKLLNTRAGRKYLTEGLLMVPEPVGRLGSNAAIGAGASLPLLNRQ